MSHFLRPISARATLRAAAGLAMLASFLFSGCGGREPELVVYCSLDQVFAEEMIHRFEEESGLRVRAEFDVEASKTVGLVRRLIEERERPRCDVFWNNEIAQTVRLAEQGLLAAYDSPSAASIPAPYKDPEHRWCGFAARARILIVNTDLADPAEIHGMADLLDPGWKGKAGIARPLTGTTLTHATALYEVMGEEAARRLLTDIAEAGSRGDLNIAASNSQVMTQVGTGTYAWGWTDTDDFNVALRKGHPVAAVWPDQDGIGALVIPNSVSIQSGAPHPENARRFVDWVLSEEVERALAWSDSAQIPLRESVGRPPHVKRLSEFRAMQVDYVAIGKQIAARTEELKGLFLK